MSDDGNKLLSRIRKALNVLGVKNFVLSIHDAAFPSLPEEDIGRGSPYSHGAHGFLRFVRDLGFDGVQLGPQGITSAENLSPYDSTFFSRNPLSLAVRPLMEEPWNLLRPEYVSGLLESQSVSTDRIDKNLSQKALSGIADEIDRWLRFNDNGKKTGRQVGLRRSFDQFLHDNMDWLERDGLYEILRNQYGQKTWKEWGESREAHLDKRLFAPLRDGERAVLARKKELKRRYRKAMEAFCFIQYLLYQQHMELKKFCRCLGLKLFGDCQIGLSGRDTWSAQSFLLPGYLLGAPPSRTNPEGQPWNYPVPDPHKYWVLDPKGRRIAGPAQLFFKKRIDKLIQEFDGIRIDHPHGLICPWVYRADGEDAHKAVREGARLFASPALPDHPRLGEYAIVRPDQINPQAKRYDDDWVTDLATEQILQYALRFEEIVTSARDNHGGPYEIICEILSTRPYPIRKVIELYGLGHFLVTQKANLNNPRDIYRSENALPQDWVMLGNHDTPSIWQVAKRWQQDGESRHQAVYLAERLRIAEDEREKWVQHVAADGGELAQAKFADLFVGPGRNIMVFFTDLLGIRQSYNIPGTVSPENWSLRINPDYRRKYHDKSSGNLALNIPKALAMALRARGDAVSIPYRDLIADLESFQAGSLA